jgi:hypothetical protein
MIIKPSRPESRTKDTLKPKHGILCQALSCTPTRDTPGIPTLLLNLTKIGIPDSQRILSVITPHLLRVSPRGNRRFRTTLAN